MESPLRNLFILFFTFVSFGTVYAVERPSHIHEVYFEGTNYELHIYRINGRIDGNTMLIVGGIQGDEPGGFLSADLYSDLALEKGNLIVVPRANLKSVILFNRGADGDMNRLFQSEKSDELTIKVVEKLEGLIKESDIFLNLHDGWGFHNPDYIDKSRNPTRFGQSVIIDGENFACSDNSSLPLGEMARKVLYNVNQKIPDKNFHLHLFDTKTGDNESKFKDMRKTATWYALNNGCVPAFGVEGSKNLKSIEQNVLYHNYVVNEFMKIMEIVPEQPKVMIVKPEMSEAVIKVNGDTIQVRPGANVDINKGDVVEVVYVESNYTRGITCDILGYGSLNDMNKPTNVSGSTKIIFRKDNSKVGEIYIRSKEVAKTDMAKNPKPQKTEGQTLWVFLVKVDGKYKTIAADETLKIKNGSNLEIIKLFSDKIYDADLPINIKGWYPPNESTNPGDDRGYKISFPAKNIMKKYATKPGGNVFPVVAGETANPTATMFIETDL